MRKQSLYELAGITIMTFLVAAISVAAFSITITGINLLKDYLANVRVPLPGM